MQQYNAIIDTMIRISKLNAQDRAQTEHLYDLYTKKYQMDNGWFEGNKEANYREMIKIAELAGKPLQHTSCLDVGCGTGDLSAFLRQHGISSYLGIDIYEPALQQARHNYPDETFVNRDILEGGLPGRFDYIFCSGTFTVKLSVDNYDFFESMLTVLWEKTRHGFVCNFLTTDEPNADPRLFFYDPVKMAAIVTSVAPDAGLLIEESPYQYQNHVFLYRTKNRIKN